MRWLYEPPTGSSPTSQSGAALGEQVEQIEEALAEIATIRSLLVG
jgi:hypothetical protein